MMFRVFTGQRNSCPGHVPCILVQASDTVVTRFLPAPHSVCFLEIEAAVVKLFIKLAGSR